MLPNKLKVVLIVGDLLIGGIERERERERRRERRDCDIDDSLLFFFLLLIILFSKGFKF